MNANLTLVYCTFLFFSVFYFNFIFYSTLFFFHLLYLTLFSSLYFSSHFTLRSCSYIGRFSPILWKYRCLGLSGYPVFASWSLFFPFFSVFYYNFVFYFTSFLLTLLHFTLFPSLCFRSLCHLVGSWSSSARCSCSNGRKSICTFDRITHRVVQLPAQVAGTSPRSAHATKCETCHKNKSGAPKTDDWPSPRIVPVTKTDGWIFLILSCRATKMRLEPW